MELRLTGDGHAKVLGLFNKKKTHWSLTLNVMFSSSFGLKLKGGWEGRWSSGMFEEP